MIDDSNTSHVSSIALFHHPDLILGDLKRICLGRVTSHTLNFNHPNAIMSLNAQILTQLASVPQFVVSIDNVAKTQFFERPTDGVNQLIARPLDEHMFESSVVTDSVDPFVQRSDLNFRLNTYRTNLRRQGDYIWQFIGTVMCPFVI